VIVPIIFFPNQSLTKPKEKARRERKRERESQKIYRNCHDLKMTQVKKKFALMLAIRIKLCWNYDLGCIYVKVQQKPASGEKHPSTQDSKFNIIARCMVFYHFVW
jgi:hypothetical protein